MFKRKELIHIFIALLVFGFIIAFLQGFNMFFRGILIAFIILTVNIMSKKLMAHHVDAEIEQKILQWQRWGWYERSYFKHPLPMGIILPFLLALFSYPFGFIIKFLTFLQFDVKASKSRRVRRAGGLYRFAEMTEFHIAHIAAIGTGSVLALAIISYLLASFTPLSAFFSDLSRFSIYYAISNILPLGQLDGAKLLFGSRIWWFILTVLSIIGFGLALFLI